MPRSDFSFEREPDLDLGHDHYLFYTGWKPDRELNPQYDGIPDIEKAGAIVWHLNAKTGEPCAGGIHFDVPHVAEVLEGAVWQVHSWDPLHTEPSLLCSCGDHGWIRDGKWEPA